MEAFGKKSAAQAERRTEERRPAHGDLRMHVDAQACEGRLDNVSRAGALFTAPAGLRVTVEWEEDGEAQRRSGRLVRVLRMDEDELGFAVEFD